jgi:hypothetical protein
VGEGPGSNVQGIGTDCCDDKVVLIGWQADRLGELKSQHRLGSLWGFQKSAASVTWVSEDTARS